MPPDVVVKKRRSWVSPEGKSSRDELRESSEPKKVPFPKEFKLAADDIVMCLFPYNGEKTQKAHPAIVLHTGRGIDGTRWAVVAGGTSLCNKLGYKQGNLKPSDFVIDEAHLDGTGLRNPTRFQFESLNSEAYSGGEMQSGTIIALPITEEFFMVPKNKLSPVIGSLNPGQHRIYDEFILKQNVIKKADDECKRYSKRGISLLKDAGINLEGFQPASISEERQRLMAKAVDNGLSRKSNP